jgi:hypothetical protein
MKTTGSNGTDANTNTDRVRPLFRPSANENIRGNIPARDIAAAMAEGVYTNERFGFRLHYPLPRSGLAPPNQAVDSSMRGFLQAVEPDRWA